MKTLNAQVEALTDELDKRTNQQAQLEKQLRESSSSSAASNSNATALSKLQSECDELREQLQRSEQRHSETKHWLDETVRECSALRVALDDTQVLRDRVVTLERQLAELNRNLDDAHAQLASYSSSSQHRNHASALRDSNSRDTTPTSAQSSIIDELRLLSSSDTNNNNSTTSSSNNNNSLNEVIETTVTKASSSTKNKMVGYLWLQVIGTDDKPSRWCWRRISLEGDYMYYGVGDERLRNANDTAQIELEHGVVSLVISDTVSEFVEFILLLIFI